MPNLSTHQSQSSTKMLLIGDSGSGKTGALASLVEAGYELIIFDFDNGLDILVNILRTKPNAEELLSRITFTTCTDKLKAVGGMMRPDGPPTAFTSALKLLTEWETEDENLGKSSEWGPEKIIVIDSLTMMCKAAFRYVEIINGFKDGRQTYGEAQRLIESMLGLLYSEAIRANVIVTSHITFIDTDAGLTKGYPSSIGKALSPQIPRYFNTVLETKTKGTGANARHVILTQPDGLIELKNSAAPGKVPVELPIETGLATFFKLAKGE